MPLTKPKVKSERLRNLPEAASLSPFAVALIQLFADVYDKIDEKLDRFMPPTCKGCLVKYTCGHETRVHSHHCPLSTRRGMAKKCSKIPTVEIPDQCVECDHFYEHFVIDVADDVVPTAGDNTDAALLDKDVTKVETNNTAPSLD